MTIWQTLIKCGIPTAGKLIYLYIADHPSDFFEIQYELDISEEETGQLLTMLTNSGLVSVDNKGIFSATGNVTINKHTIKAPKKKTPAPNNGIPKRFSDEQIDALMDKITAIYPSEYGTTEAKKEVKKILNSPRYKDMKEDDILYAVQEYKNECLVNNTPAKYVKRINNFFKSMMFLDYISPERKILFGGSPRKGDESSMDDVFASDNNDYAIAELNNIIAECDEEVPVPLSASNIFAPPQPAISEVFAEDVLYACG